MWDTVLKHFLGDLWTALLHVVTEVLKSGNAPRSWQITLFNVFPKIRAAKSDADFRPIADVSLLYKLTADLMLARMEESPEAMQLEEPHGFW